MKPINIYALTRIEKEKNLSRLERQMSERDHFLKVKGWEINSLRSFIGQLCVKMREAPQLLFYFSFQIPNLGKEFDLLRISKELVVNVELKSFVVPDEHVQKQLLQNHYYLSTLGMNIRSYTYISEEKRLLRLTKSGRIVETTFDELCEDLRKQQEMYEGDIEELFRAEKFLISPLLEPDKFLRREYFLTYQQRDIKNQIMKNLQGRHAGEAYSCFQGFTGLPGTGKTLLLYDLAMALSTKQRVCIIHAGKRGNEFSPLSERLKRIDFIDEESITDFAAYDVIFVDEGNRVTLECLEKIIFETQASKTPIIFTYDSEENIAEEERGWNTVRYIEELPEYKKFTITNHIRMNRELSSFVNNMMHKKYNMGRDFWNVSVSYANDDEEAGRLLKAYISKGYVYIRDEIVEKGHHLNLMEKISVGDDMEKNVNTLETEQAFEKELERVVMFVDQKFLYDSERYLIAPEYRTEGTSAVKKLFYGLNRAKEKIAIVVENESLFEQVLEILQNDSKMNA